MRMVISCNLWPARARRPVRIDERLRIDLEMTRWLGMYVSSGNDAHDAPACAQEDPATLKGMHGLGFGAQSCDDLA